MSTLDELFNEWQNNTAFRKAFAKNPEQALEQFGFKLSEEDLKTVLETLKTDDEGDGGSGSNKKNHFEELEKRINR